jgi:hypothetical protein
MAGKRRKKIREREITGLKYFKKLLSLLSFLSLLERLHDDGCAGDKAGNRKLHEVDRSIPRACRHP